MSQRRMMMNASNEKAKNLSKTLSTLLKYLKPFRIAIFFVILFAVGSTIFTIIGPKILGNATTKLVQGLIHYLYYLEYMSSLAFSPTFKHGLCQVLHRR